MMLEATIKHIGNLDEVIHNPARLMIVYLLSQKNSLDYVSLMQKTNLTSGNITTHLNKLMERGYVLMHKGYAGRRPQSIIELTDAGMSAYRKWAENVIWALPEQMQRLAQPQVYQGWNRHALALRDWRYIAPESQVFPILPEHMQRNLDLRPLEEMQRW